MTENWESFSVRVLIATCIAALVLRFVDLAYFGGSHTEAVETVIPNYGEAAEAIIRRMASALPGVLRG